MGLVKTRRRLAEDGSPHRAGAETAAREGGMVKRQCAGC